MEYKIKIKCDGDEIKNITVSPLKSNTFTDSNYICHGDETLRELIGNIEVFVESLAENRVVSEKKRIKNSTVANKEPSSIEKAKLAKMKYLDERAEYIKQVFTGGKGSGKSARGGEYAGANNLEIFEVIELVDKEVWYFKKRD